MRTWRNLLILLALGAAGLTGCGGGDGDELGDVELIRTAASATEAAGSARMEMVMDLAGQELTAEGAFDFEAEQGTVSMDFGDAVGDLPDAPDDLTFEAVYDRTTVFMSSGIFGPLASGAEWVRMDLEEIASMSGVDLDELPTSNNPADALAALAGVSEDGVEDLGQEEVRGVDTTHYRATIDLQQAVDTLGVADSEDLDAALEQFGDSPFEVEVWIDDEGLVRRETTSVDAGGDQVATTMEFFDFGEDVDIDVPDESDSVDLLDLMGDLGGLPGN